MDAQKQIDEVLAGRVAKASGQASCEICRWWDNSVQLQNAQQDTTGACRYSAPRINKMTGRAAWPFTEDSDWCGCFTGHPDKIELPF